MLNDWVLDSLGSSMCNIFLHNFYTGGPVQDIQTGCYTTLVCFQHTDTANTLPLTPWQKKPRAQLWPFTSKRPAVLVANACASGISVSHIKIASLKLFQKTIHGVRQFFRFGMTQAVISISYCNKVFFITCIQAYRIEKRNVFLFSHIIFDFEVDELFIQGQFHYLRNCTFI